MNHQPETLLRLKKATAFGGGSLLYWGYLVLIG